MRRLFLVISLLSFSLMGATEYTDSQEFKNKIARIERWRSLVDEVQNERGYDFDTDKIMAIIAQESGGNPWIVSTDEHGSVGLMQCTPRPWTASGDRLKNPKVNIQCGLWVLTNAMGAAKDDWFDALRFYNCGAERGKERPSCGAYYADRVLSFWLPHFQQSFNVSGVIIKGSCLEFVLRYDKDYNRACTAWDW